jgi:hypothetical protein
MTPSMEELAEAYLARLRNPDRKVMDRHLAVQEEEPLEEVEGRLTEYFAMVRRKRNPVSERELARACFAIIEVWMAEKNYEVVEVR